LLFTSKLNLSFFISKRISRQSGEGFSSSIHKIAVASIGIGLGAAIVAFLIMRGFQDTVKNKIYSFSGHLVVTKFTMNYSMEESPMDINIDFYNNYSAYPGIRHVQEYAHKAGLIKTDDEVLGVVVKGIGKTFDTTAFESNIIAGRFIHFPDSGYANEVMLSKTIARKISAHVDDQVIVHFFQNPPRFRRLKVVGIYETNLSEYFDEKIIMSDIRMIARLNEWADSIAGGLEVFVSDINRIDEIGYDVGETIDFDLNIMPVREKYIQVFEWLHLLNRQVNILLVVILAVVCVNMISIILILVMERTQMIGMLKALGASDKLIRSVFVYNGISLVVKGLLMGNLIGLGFCFLQYKFRFITLNPEDYYMSFVPISWHWETVILLNAITFLIVTVVLLLPTAVIARIDPIKAIRFD
jgi:lipoprotein-releasing system permease protein